MDPSQVDIIVLARYTSGGGLASNQVLTAQLRDMGWNAKLESLDRTAGLEKLNDGGGWHAAYYGGASPLHEPDGTLARYVAPAGQRHYAGAVDPKYDALLQTILTTVRPHRPQGRHRRHGRIPARGHLPAVPHRVGRGPGIEVELGAWDAALLRRVVERPGADVAVAAIAPARLRPERVRAWEQGWS